MIRRGLNLLSARSVVVPALTVALWVRSHSVQDNLRRYSVPVLSLASNAGWVEAKCDSPPGPLWFRHVGTSYYQQDVAYPWPDSPKAELLHHDRGWRITLPYWLLTGAALAPAVLIIGGRPPARIALRQLGRFNVGRRRGFCRQCGYDLRATPDRCPECGTPAGGANA